MKFWNPNLKIFSYFYFSTFFCLKIASTELNTEGLIYDTSIYVTFNQKIPSFSLNGGSHIKDIFAILIITNNKNNVIFQFFTTVHFPVQNLTSNLTLKKTWQTSWRQLFAKSVKSFRHRKSLNFKKLISKWTKFQ